MKLQRVKMNEYDYLWTVLDDKYLPIKPIQSFVHYLYNIERSPNTIRAYANHLLHYWKFLKHIQKKWTEVKINDLAEFVHWLRTGETDVICLSSKEALRTEQTVNTIISSLSSFYDFHQKLGNTTITLTQTSTTLSRRYKPLLYHLSKNKPTKTSLIRMKTMKALPKLFTADQVSILLKACHSKRDQFLISLLYETGMRIGQVLGLQHKDIKSWDNEIHIIPYNKHVNGARTKSREPYVVHVTPSLMALYSRYVVEECEHIQNDYVFVQIKSDTPGKPLTYQTIRALFKRLSKQTGIRITAHMFRHTHATELIRAGWDMGYVQKRLGHSSIQTTMNTYAHLCNDDLKQAFKAYQKNKETRYAKA